MPYVTAAVVVGSALYKYFDASSRKKKSDRALKELQKKQYRYETLRDAELAIRQGFSPEERSAFQGQLARSQAQGYRRATEVNPNLASAVTAGMNYTNVGALADFASRDAALRRQRQQAYLQRSDLETDRQLRDKMMQEQQYGLASQQASADMSNAIGGTASAFVTMYGTYQGARGGKKGSMFGGGKKKIGSGDPENAIQLGQFGGYNSGDIYDSWNNRNK